MKTLALLSLLLLASVVGFAETYACPCGTEAELLPSWTCYQYANFFCIQDWQCVEIQPEDPDWSPVMCLSLFDGPNKYLPSRRADQFSHEEVATEPKSRLMLPSLPAQKL